LRLFILNGIQNYQILDLTFDKDAPLNLS
jgi:hypothetical protein